MTHEEAFDYTKISYKIDISPIIAIAPTLKDDQILEIIDYVVEQSAKQSAITATILACIALLQISGENTKQAVIDKLRGCVE